MSTDPQDLILDLPKDNPAIVSVVQFKDGKTSLLSDRLRDAISESKDQALLQSSPRGIHANVAANASTKY